jgi:hypothetical protein
MGRKRAPQHRLDHEPQYVAIDDSAWDQDLVGKTLLNGADEHELASGDVVSLVPLRRYLRGLTRFDLQEPALVELIAKTGCLRLEEAEVWTLRVLPFDVRLKVAQAAEIDPRAAHMTAFAHGVVALRTPDTDADAAAAIKAIAAMPAKDRKSSQIQALYEGVARYRFDALDDVGWAVKKLSSDLSEEERKN